MKQKGLIGAVITAAFMAVIVFAVSEVLAPAAQQNAEKERSDMMARLLPGSTSFVQEAYSGDEPSILAVYKGQGGYVIETVAAGYAGDIKLMVGVSSDGKVTGVVVRDMKETYGLGAKALRDTDFLSQFLNTSGGAAVGENVDAISGATVTSKAIAWGVNSAVAYVTGSDISSEATEWGG